MHQLYSVKLKDEREKQKQRISVLYDSLQASYCLQWSLRFPCFLPSFLLPPPPSARAARFPAGFSAFHSLPSSPPFRPSPCLLPFPPPSDPQLISPLPPPFDKIHTLPPFSLVLNYFRPSRLLSAHYQSLLPRSLLPKEPPVPYFRPARPAKIAQNRVKYA